MATRNLWSRQELLLAINLYCKTPFGKLHHHNPEIIELANSLGRTPSALTWKLVNFASLDPSLQARGIKGAKNVSNLDREIWNEFFNNWEELAYESEKLLKTRVNKAIQEEKYDENYEDIEVERTVKTRVKQSFFRSTLLASYNYTCCITGISNPDFLIASHIVPWSIDQKNRLNPRNGILINSLHDKAFEHGYITISEDYKIKVCDEILLSQSEWNKKYFHQIHNREMILPNRFLPDRDFIQFHIKNKFRG